MEASEFLELIHLIESFAKISFSKSASKSGTYFYDGDVLGTILRFPKMLEFVGRGDINIWSAIDPKSGKLYTFIQSFKGMMPRKSDFNLFPNLQWLSLEQLRADVSIVESPDPSHPEQYPWESKMHLSGARIWEYYQSEGWNSTRKQIFRTKTGEVGRTCSCCRQNFTSEHDALMNIHHRVPIKNGGGNQIFNLVPLCVACHALVHRHRWLLIESLFIYYAYSREVGNSRIKSALEAQDTSGWRAGSETYSQTYERLCAGQFPISASLFFFAKINEAVTYHATKQQLFYSELYFLTRKISAPDDGHWQTGGFASGAIIYDCVACFALMWTLSGTVAYFESTQTSIPTPTRERKATEYRTLLSLSAKQLLEIFNLPGDSNVLLAELECVALQPHNVLLKSEFVDFDFGSNAIPAAVENGIVAMVGEICIPVHRTVELQCEIFDQTIKDVFRDSAKKFNLDKVKFHFKKLMPNPPKRDSSPPSGMDEKDNLPF